MNGEISPIGVNKGLGVTKVLEFFGADRSNSYGFGDGDNDRPLLQACEHSIAMGNADPELKAIADYITAPVDQDGLALAFKHFGLI
jgi:hydroxymethylpyrimidine pyrophosphatase-like HAD family hydrolase